MAAVAEEAECACRAAGATGSGRTSNAQASAGVASSSFAGRLQMAATAPGGHRTAGGARTKSPQSKPFRR